MTPQPMLIDEYLPRYDVVERHSITVRATPARTFAAITTTDFADGPVVRLLLWLRKLPQALLRGRDGWRALTSTTSVPLTIGTIERNGFRHLAQRVPEELVIGIEGQFWVLSGGRCTPSAEAFSFVAPAPGMARAIWNFHVQPLGGERCKLTTETRVLCADAAARRPFLLYWALIRPGSGLIRHSMLRAIKRSAEHQDVSLTFPASK